MTVVFLNFICNKTDFTSSIFLLQGSMDVVQGSMNLNGKRGLAYSSLNRFRVNCKGRWQIVTQSQYPWLCHQGNQICSHQNEYLDIFLMLLWNYNNYQSHWEIWFNVLIKEHIDYDIIDQNNVLTTAIQYERLPFELYIFYFMLLKTRI